ncbi:MAG: winged helix-turn-helix transcriptional regulator [Candidatus Doudnabacteria bacterium]|nr:winged helix-turn-helix transcriptional regulator [Candidatus Doudnabacteria bacterium]
MIEKLLKNLGFGDKEIKVYLTLLHYGKITPASLAKLVNLNRTTVYSLAKELVQKGVISEDLGGPALYLVAKPPHDLINIVQIEEKHLEEKKAVIKNAVEELQKISRGTEYSIPKIVFKTQDEIEQYLYSQTPAWDESILKYDGTWWGFQDHTFVQHYEKWIDWYWQTGSNPATKLKLLSNELAEEIKKTKYERRQINFWEQSHNFKTTTWILGDYVVMIVTNQRPHYLVEIYDRVLAHDQREIFKGIWKTLIQNRP